MVLNKVYKRNKSPNLVESSLEENHFRVIRNVTLVLFISELILLLNETFAYYANDYHFLFLINSILFILLMVDLALLLARRIDLYLAFCRMSIEYLGGRIWISDTSPGGTTISFALPLSNGSSEAVAIIRFKVKYAMALAPEEMKKLDIYKAGQIFHHLSSPVILNTSKLDQWFHDIKNSVYSANKIVYQTLIAQIVTDSNIPE